MTEEIDWEKLKLTESHVYTFNTPPKANWRFYFGDSRQGLYFQFYVKNPPNRLQRWCIKKILGITWEKI